MFRLFLCFIALIIGTVFFFLKIFGGVLSATFEYFCEQIDKFSDHLSIVKLAKELRDENKQLKKKIEILENEKIMQNVKCALSFLLYLCANRGCETGL